VKFSGKCIDNKMYQSSIKEELIMGEVSFKGAIKSSLKSAKVPLLKNMGDKRADTLIRKLSDRLPLEDRGKLLKADLADMSYLEAKSHLRKTLPPLTIGISFDKDKRECSLLESLSAKEAIFLFIQFGPYADRAKNMWHSYYNYDKSKAVKLLDIFANKRKDLILNALLGNFGHGEIDPARMSEILKTGFQYTLSDMLIKLENPTIMSGLRTMEFSDIYDHFILPWTIYESYGDEALIRSVIRSLGKGKAFDFYKYLVEIREIEGDLEIREPEFKALENMLTEKILNRFKENAEWYLYLGK
jgi:hypothetical protein